MFLTKQIIEKQPLDVWKTILLAQEGATPATIYNIFCVILTPNTPESLLSSASFPGALITRMKQRRRRKKSQNRFVVEEISLYWSNRQVKNQGNEVWLIR